MQYQWILDVLGDVRAFALRNGMKELALQMDKSLAVAASDISRMGDWPVLVFSNPARPSNDEAAGGAE